MTFPAPAMTLDLVAALRRVLADPRRRFQRPGAGVQRERDAKSIGELADAPVAGARAVFEVAFQAEVRRAFDLLHRLVDRLVALIARRDEELGALFDVEHDRHRDPRAVRPAHVRVAVGVAAQIPGHAAALAHNASAARCASRRTSSRSANTGLPPSTTMRP